MADQPKFKFRFHYPSHPGVPMPEPEKMVRVKLTTREAQFRVPDMYDLNGREVRKVRGTKGELTTWEGYVPESRLATLRAKVEQHPDELAQAELIHGRERDAYVAQQLEKRKTEQPDVVRMQAERSCPGSVEDVYHRLTGEWRKPLVSLEIVEEKPRGKSVAA